MCGWSVASRHNLTNISQKMYSTWLAYYKWDQNGKVLIISEWYNGYLYTVVN